MFDWTLNAPSIEGAVNVGWRQTASAWNLVPHSCTVKHLRVDQTVRNFTCGDLEIPLVVIGQGVTGL